MKIAVVCLLWTLLQYGRQRRQVERLRQGRNIAHDPIVRRRGRQPRRGMVRPWLHSERRLQFGHFYRLMEELRLEDGGSFRNFLRMEPAMFDELLHRIRPRKAKQDTWYLQAIDPGLKLVPTLRHLATGDTYTSLSYDFRVNNCTISTYVPGVCTAIVEEYKYEVIPCPTTSEEWHVIAEEFERRWNVPHACGAVDRKHVAIKKPLRSGSLYYNYKGFFSVVLIALVDANYRFLWVDVGGHGAMFDRQIFNNSELSHVLKMVPSTSQILIPSPMMTKIHRTFCWGMMLSHLKLS